MWDARIQMHGSSKPIFNQNAIQPIQSSQETKKWNGKKSMKERRKELLMKKDFLDKKTVKYLEKVGLINNSDK